MEASIVDLRYKMKDVLKALKRNEVVKVYYRDTICGVLMPAHSNKKSSKVKDHPFFGMHSDISISVEKEMDRLRGGRFEDM